MIDLLIDNFVLRLLLLLLVFGLVSVLVYAGIQAFTGRQVAQRRLAQGPVFRETTSTRSSLRSDQLETNWLKLVNAIEKGGLSLVDTKNEELREKLISAGFTAPHAPRVYTLIRLILIVGLPALVLGILWFGGSTPSLIKLYFGLVVAAAAGLYLPALFIRARADRRQQEIVNAFPDALDLLLVCVEAGLGLEAAFARVGMEMTTSHPRLAHQFGAVVLELRAGRSHEDALRRMANRAGADEIRAFTTLLIQSTKLGSSIATTLRVYASEMRERRRMRAEEKAHRLPVLLSIPLVACMLPTMIGVLMLPAVIRMMRSMFPAMGGG